MVAVPRRVFIVIAALVLALGPLLGAMPLVSPPTVGAFYPHQHFPMFQAAVGSNFSDEAKAWVNEGLERNDAFPKGHAHPEWHFDTAKDPAAICDLWHAHDPGKRMGPNKLLSDAAVYAVEAFNASPFDPAGIDRVGGFRREALIAYGQYLHAIQDFYSHTNWIELHVAAGTQPGLAPIQAGCDATALAALQPKLQGGYFDVYSAAPDFCGSGWPAGLVGMGSRRPPAGYDYCHGPPEPTWYLWLVGPSQLPAHFMLSKDVPGYYHGKETFQLPGGAPTTYHDEAVRLATLATTETFAVFHDRVVARFKADLPDRDPVCLFQVLLKGGNPACPKRVGLGGHYQGEIPAAGAQVAALLTNPPGRYGELRDVRAAIQLDPATNSLLGGSLSFEGTLASPPFPANLRDVYDAPKAEGVGPFYAASGGILGRLIFRGTSTTHLPDGTSISATEDRAFLYASDQAGRVVLCPDEPTMATLSDPETDRQECMDRAVIELQPVQPIACAVSAQSWHARS